MSRSGARRTCCGDEIVRHMPARRGTLYAKHDRHMGGSGGLQMPTAHVAPRRGVNTAPVQVGKQPRTKMQIRLKNVCVNVNYHGSAKWPAVTTKEEASNWRSPPPASGTRLGITKAVSQYCLPDSPFQARGYAAILRCRNGCHVPRTPRSRLSCSAAAPVFGRGPVAPVSRRRRRSRWRPPVDEVDRPGGR